MKKRRIPLAGIAAIGVSALLLSGCSGAAGSSEGGDVTLDFWSWAPNTQELVDVWNEENPDIQVTVNKQDGGDPAITKLLTAIKAGSGAPDLIQAEYQKIPTLVASDALADLIGPLIEKLQAKRGAPNVMTEAVGSKVTGLEVGGLLGFMSSKVLGQFDPFYDGPGLGADTGPSTGRLLLVAPTSCTWRTSSTWTRPGWCGCCTSTARRSPRASSRAPSPSMCMRRWSRRASWRGWRRCRASPGWRSAPTTPRRSR